MHYLIEIAIWRYLSLHWRGVLGWIWLISGIYLAIRIILQRRAPAATLAWIMALCLMPIRCIFSINTRYFPISIHGCLR